MGTLKGRRLFFATRADLVPGLRAVENQLPVEYVLDEMRDDQSFTVLQQLSEASDLGHTTAADTNNSPGYLIFRRGEAPAPRAIPQRRGGVKYVVEPTGECLILRCGGLHAPTGALLHGELQLPLDPGKQALELFELFSRGLFRAFTRVGDYSLGPEAFAGYRAGQRLVTIAIRSPREYDLAD